MNTRDKILHTAAMLFQAQGYQSTTMDEIAVRSGIAKSNLYYHYPSKETLGSAVAQAQMTTYREEVGPRTLRNEALRPAQRLASFLKETSPSGIAGVCFRDTAEGSGRLSEPLRGLICRYVRTLEADLAACLRAGMTIGEFHADLNPECVAQLVLVHLEGASRLGEWQLGVPAIPKAADTLLALLQTAPPEPTPPSSSIPATKRRLRKLTPVRNPNR